MSQVRTLSLETPKSISILHDITIVILSSILISLFGKIAIPLPFSPIPIATQPTLILLMALFLGRTRAVAAVFAFLAQGAMGLPVFAKGLGGIAILMGPTGGYLIGYLAAAFTIGYIMERCRERTILNAFLAMAAGNTVIYLFGAAYLSTFVGFQKALLLGVAPFIVGDLVKMAAGIKILQWTGWTSKS